MITMKFINFIKRLLPSKRKLIQLYFALLFNVNFKGFKTGQIYRGATKNLCVPGINCYSCPGAVGSCPLGSMQGALSNGHTTIFYVFGIILLFSIIFGRMICAWLCPFGYIQELVYKVKTKKVKKSKFTRILSYLKYVILIVFVFIIPICYAIKDVPFPAFCKFICPAGTLEGAMGLLANKVNNSFFSMLGPLFTWKFLLMVSIIVGAIFVYRLFCRFLCPLGALYGLFNRFSIFGIKLDNAKCTNCSLCVNRCKLDVYKVGDQECISCGECIDVCPTKAISWKGPQIFIKKNDIPEEAISTDSISKSKKRNVLKLITHITTIVLMLALLIGAACYYWTRDDGTPDKSQEYTYGTDVGNKCYEYDLEVVDSNGVSGTIINPTKTGKITIVNFWGTWCTPCVEELPHFNEIAVDYKDSVCVIAIHSYMLRDTAPEYIKKHYADYQIIFAHDYADPGYYNQLGGLGAYPYTLILDEDGVIQKVFVKKVGYDDLKNAIEEIKNK